MIDILHQHRTFSAFSFGFVFFLTTLLAGAQVTHLDIEQALALSLRSNEELKYARLDYEFEVSRYYASFRDFLPAVTVDYAQEDSVAYYAPDSHLKKLSIGIDQLLYAGGARIYERRSLAGNLRIRERMIEEMEKELRLEVMNRYVEILTLGLQIGILEESLAMARDQVGIARQELKLGEITRIDCIDIELAVQDLEIELAALKQEEVRLKFELKEMLHIPSIHSLELAGAINPDFRGMLPNQEPGYYVECALRNSLDLRRRSSEIADLSNQVKQARCSWVPKISTQVELSATGESFPLTDPGFSVGLSLDFSAPLLPFSTGITAGSPGLEERSLGLSSSVALGENLRGWQTLRMARVELRKAETNMETARRTLEFSILQQLKTRAFLLDAIRLEEKRSTLQEQRLSIEAVMLEIGEITRLEYLQSGVALTRRSIDQLSRIVSLFQMEAVLLAQCGLDILERSHRYILRAIAEEIS